MSTGVTPGVTPGETPGVVPDHGEDWQLRAAILWAGAWLFRWRSWVPAPIPIALLTLRGDEAGAPWFVYSAGALLVIGGEALRLWATRYIGASSRTRESGIETLIVEGPYSLVRNPLYCANVLLWSGLTCLAALPSLLPVVWAFLALEYHCIVVWEESRLARRFGRAYEGYLQQVPRWVPDVRRATRAFRSPSYYSWMDTLQTEHDTLLVLVIMVALLYVKGSTA